MRKEKKRESIRRDGTRASTLPGRQQQQGQIPSFAGSNHYEFEYYRRLKSTRETRLRQGGLDDPTDVSSSTAGTLELWWDFVERQYEISIFWGRRP